MQIRETIDCFCSILNFFGIDIQAEIFRKSKHNDQENKNELLELIFKLSLMRITDNNLNFKKCNITIKDFEKLKCLILMILKNFECPFIIEDSDAMSINLNDSRDLLMIAGWLISVNELFETFRKNLFKKINKKFENIKASCEIGFTKTKQTMFKESLSKENRIKDFNEEDLVEIYNRILNKFLILIRYNNEKEKNVKEIEKEINSKKFRFEEKDFYLLLNNDKLNHIINEYEQSIEILENQIKSIKHEELFWLWMQSVIETDKKELLDNQLYGFNDETSKNVFVNIKNHTELEQLLEELKELNLNYKSSRELFDSFEDRWKDKKKEIEEDSGQINKLKLDSIRILEFFEKKFLDFPNMKKILKKEVPSNIILSELQSLFNYEKENDEGISTLAYEKILSRIENEAKKLKKNISDKYYNLFKIYGEVFDIYPTKKKK